MPDAGSRAALVNGSGILLDANGILIAVNGVGVPSSIPTNTNGGIFGGRLYYYR
jgi:hypothetical protein